MRAQPAVSWGWLASTAAAVEAFRWANADTIDG